MNIHSVAIHEIVKGDQSTGASLFLTNNYLESSNENVATIITTLDASFSNKTIRRAKFSEDGFKQTIENFNNFDLLSCSRALTEKLKDGIQNIPAAKGGYLVFCKYYSTRTFLSVFLVRNTKGAFLKRAGNDSWDIESPMYLDIEHFAMGVRINLDTLNSDSEDRYIHLAKGNTDISEYFENWIGIDDTKQEAKDGDALYQIANNINLPDGISDRDEFKKQIFDYANGRPSKIVNLSELSTYLYDDSSFITNYCNENDFDIDGEFRLAGNQLKRFVKVSVTAGGIKLEASRDKFNPTGISVSDDCTMVTIRSLELAAEIRSKL